MRNWLIRTAWMIPMFGGAFGWHSLAHAGHPFWGGMLGGFAFVIGEHLIRRPE